jgi:hypothetical protein
MSIGLSRNAELLLIQLARIHHRGELQGFSGDQLSFTLSVRPNQTTVEFANGNPPLQTGDANAMLVLRANGLIEEFTTLERTSKSTQYVVTQAGLNVVGRSISFEEQYAVEVLDADACVPAEVATRGAPDDRVYEPVSNTKEKSHG